MQERPDATYQESHTAASPETEKLPKEHDAVAVIEPLAVVFETADDCPLARASTEYPETVAEEHPGTEPVFAPSTRAPLDDGFVVSRTNPATAQTVCEGKSPLTSAVPLASMTAVWVKLLERAFDPLPTTTSAVPTSTYFGSAAANASKKDRKSEILNFSLLSLSLA